MFSLFFEERSGEMQEVKGQALTARDVSVRRGRIYLLSQAVKEVETGLWISPQQ